MFPAAVESGRTAVAEGCGRADRAGGGCVPVAATGRADLSGAVVLHTYGRAKDQHLMIPSWPYSVIAALETGRTSWTAVLDALRLPPDADLAAVTAVQVRELVLRLIKARQWWPGQPDILIVFDAGYGLPRLALLLADLPVEVLGRLRSDRVLRRPAPLPFGSGSVVVTGPVDCRV